MAEYEDKAACEAIRLWQEAKTRRSVWDGRFQEVVDYCRPSTDSFTGKKSPGAENNQIYDATAVDALEEFSSGLHSYLTNPSDRWFNIRPSDPRLMHDRHVREFCEEVSDIIYHYYQSSGSGHTQAMSELFLDVGSFGTGVLHQYWKDGLKFKTFALADCWIKENADRQVDTVFRRIEWTARQMLQEFGELPPKVKEATEKQKKMDQPYTVIHLVMPKSDAVWLQHIKIPQEWVSYWVCVETKETLRVGGYNWFPYHAPRWVKMSTEVYGRSPALKAMPDIKMLNRLEFQLLKALSKATDPPLVVPNEAFLVPLKTSPGSINYKEPGSDQVETLPPASFQYPEQKAEEKRQSIRKMFYNDFLRMEKENVEMTAYEVQDRREEKLRLLAPMLGRQESECLGPMLTLSYMLCARNGVLPSPPEIPGGLKIEYTSPAARAQTGMRAFAMDRYIQRLIPAGQINPVVFKTVNWEAYSRELAEAMGTDPAILYTPEEVAANDQAQAAQQQQQMVMENAEPASKAIKNLSDAGLSPQSLLG